MKKKKNRSSTLPPPIFAWVTQGKTDHMVTIIDPKVLSMLNSNTGTTTTTTTTSETLLLLSSLQQGNKVLIK
jgi:hypothetical protein